MTSADRNLLFGILALQMNFIDRDALISAMNAWVLDKGESLGQILVARGALAPARRALLDPLVDEHLRVNGGDIERSLAAMSLNEDPRVEQAREALRGIADPEIQQTLSRATLPASGEHRRDTPSAIMRTVMDSTLGIGVDGPESPDGRRFSVLRPHARGGLGQVSVALDRELNREVALKEILPERVDDQESRARFVMEAEITGRLEHPGVVPLYSLGKDEKGRPYYAMRFIKGRSLKDAIEAYHRPVENGTSVADRRNLQLRDLLNRFVAVCNVIAYAHSRGVIHRDLKPANVLLGAYGETLVVDWGLAKPIGRAEPVLTLAPGEATLRPTSMSGTTETVAGTAIGTPAFMSPEQAGGRLEHVGPLSDVYCLGATLYMILTGRPPFNDPDVGTVLSRIQLGDFPPPRAIAPVTPRSLEAICLRAMALKPVDRYGSPRALAQDVERWLADEPVSVYREPLTTRLTRWGRRNRTIASSLGALLLTAVVALAVSTALIGREQARTEQQRRLAIRNLEEAQAQRDLAAARSRELGEKAEILERQLYVNRINLAQRDLQNDIDIAEQVLDQCPPALRGWEWSYLKRQCHLDLRTIRDHVESVNTVAFSPDSSLLAAGDGKTYQWAKARDTGVLSLRSARTGQEVRRFGPLQGGIFSAAFSPDGKTLATGSGYYAEAPQGEGKVVLWDVETGRALFDERHPYLVTLCVAFSPDGSLLAAGLGHYSSSHVPGRLRIWKTSGGKEVINQEMTSGGVNALAFSPDGKTLALAVTGAVELWQSSPFRKLRELKGHDDWIYALAFSPDGKELASGGWDKTIRVWNLESGTIRLSLDQHEGPVTGLCYTRDGSRLISASSDHTVRFWSTGEGRELYVLRGHSRGVGALALSPDEGLLATGGEDHTLRIWAFSKEPPGITAGFGGWVSSVAFSPDNRKVALGSGDGTLTVQDAGSGSRLLAINPKSGWISGVAFSPDGTVLAASTEYRGVKQWDASTGRHLRDLAGLGDFTRALAYSPDGAMLAACSGSHDFKTEYPPGEVCIWDSQTGNLRRTFKGHSGRVLALAFSPDGSWIASGGGPSPGAKPNPPEILVWEAATGKILRRFQGHSQPIRKIKFSRDGLRITSASEDLTVRVWNVGSGTLERTISTQSDSLASMDLSPDETRIALGSFGRAIDLIDASTGDRMLALKGHSAGVASLSFSADGTRLLSGGIDRTARIWDATPLTPPSSLVALPTRGK
ncbi:MAG: protein kinase [Isosphaeraceae bacterium]